MGIDATVMVSDSATTFGEAHRGQVVICGSHGGLYCGYLAAAAGLRAVILNDAGRRAGQCGRRLPRLWRKARHGGGGLRA